MIGQRDFDLQPGETEVLFKSLHAEGNLASYEIEIAPQRDTLAENNRAQALVSLRGQPRVLIVDEDESKTQPLATTLRAGKINVETRGAAGLPKTVADVQQFDLFLLSDVPALQISRTQMELYRSWVQDFGGGFVLLGGKQFRRRRLLSNTCETNAAGAHGA